MAVMAKMADAEILFDNVPDLRDRFFCPLLDLRCYA